MAELGVNLEPLRKPQKLVSRTVHDGREKPGVYFERSSLGGTSLPSHTAPVPGGPESHRDRMLNPRSEGSSWLLLTPSLANAQ